MREDGAMALSQLKAAGLSGPAPCKLRGKVSAASLRETGRHDLLPILVLVDGSQRRPISNGSREIPRAAKPSSR